MNLKNFRDYRDFTALINKSNLQPAQLVRQMRRAPLQTRKELAQPANVAKAGAGNTPKTMQALIVFASLTILTLFVTACP